MPLTDVQVGDCIRFSEPPSDKVYEASCDDDHALEIIAEVGPLDDLPDSYPGVATAAGMFDDACTQAYQSAEGIVRAAVTIPGPQGWEAAKQRALCGVEAQ